MNAAKVCPPPEWASAAERFVWHLDESDGNDRRFRHEVFQQWPSSIAYAVAKSYVPLYETQGRRRANLFLHDMQEKLNPPKMVLAWDGNDLVKEAEHANKYCREAIEQFPFGLDAGLYGEDPVEGAQRVKAWASAWRSALFLVCPPIAFTRGIQQEKYWAGCNESGTWSNNAEG
jgi:hypothetical protein